MDMAPSVGRPMLPICPSWRLPRSSYDPPPERRGVALATSAVTPRRPA